MQKKRVKKDNTRLLAFIILICFILIIFIIFFWDNNLIRRSPQQIFDCGKEAKEKFPDLNKIEIKEDKIIKLNNQIVMDKDKKISMIQETLLQRKRALLEAMRNDPKIALESMLSDEQRTKLNKVTQNCIENIEVIEGTLAILHADDFENDRSQNQYMLITENKEKIILHPAYGLKDRFTSGMQIKVKGLRLDDELAFDGTNDIIDKDISGINILQTASEPPILGEQKTIVIMANFQNTPQPSFSKEDVRDIVFTGIRSVNNYYIENSYNKIFLSGDVVGWYTMPNNQACDFGDTDFFNNVSETAISLADPYINFNDYSRIVVITPFDCWFGGISSLGKISVYTQDGDFNASIAISSTLYINTTGVIAHELGHGFGIMHASSIDCGNISIARTGCIKYEYGDPFDVMGNSRNYNQYNAIHKEEVGWLNSTNILDTTGLSSGVSLAYALDPIEIDTNGPKVYKIPRALDSYIYVEFRQPIGFDFNIPGNVSEGALLHIQGFYNYANQSYGPFTDYAYYSNTMLINSTANFTSLPAVYSLPIGYTFIDSATATKIKPIGIENNKLIVQVIIGKDDFNPPFLNITSLTPMPFVNNARGNITIAADAFDESGIEKVEFWYRNPDDVRFAVDTVAPYQIVLDTTKFPDGYINLYAVAYDLSGVQFSVPGNSNADNYQGFLFYTLKIQNKCIDGTSLNQCSLTKPYYCDSTGSLVKRCSLCGCKNGLCISDGSCLVSGSGKEKRIDTS